MNRIYDFISNNTVLYGVVVYIKDIYLTDLSLACILLYIKPLNISEVFIHNVRWSWSNGFSSTASIPNCISRSFSHPMSASTESNTTKSSATWHWESGVVHILTICSSIYNLCITRNQTPCISWTIMLLFIQEIFTSENDYLALSLFTIVCCCFPLSLFAVISSVMVCIILIMHTTVFIANFGTLFI